MTTTPPSVNQTLYARSRAIARSRATCNAFARYEAHKAEWASANLGATSAEYEAAMRAIARACGV